MDSKKTLLGKLIPVLLLAAILPLVASCGSVISQSVRDEADRNVTLDMVQTEPATYTGRMVVWGGSIIKTTNLAETTEVEVLETKLSGEDVPTGKETRGRFIIEARGYLDPVVFTSSRKITVAGTITGVRIDKIGMMDYPYPILSPVEIKLFEDREGEDYGDYPPWWRYRPYDPYWGPYPSYPPPYDWPYPSYPWWWR